MGDNNNQPNNNQQGKQNSGEGKKQQGISLDIRNMLEMVMALVKTHLNKVSAGPCDGLVLWMHYRWTFWALFWCFLAIFHSWYHKNTIVCASHFNAETPVKEEYLNVCLSYPYIQEDGKRRYILFYRWVHWSFLLLAILFYLPRKVSKNLDNLECKKLLEDLSKKANVYDWKEETMVDKAHKYMAVNLRTHNGLYWKYLAVNVMALLADIFAFEFLDFVLQGRFLLYGYRSLPFSRDPQNFTDYMSQTFPPFVSCELSLKNQLVGRRTEILGCHLTVMELYEKLFLLLWLWLLALMVFSFFYLIFLLLLWVPWVRFLLLRFSKPVQVTTKGSKAIQDVLKNSKIGDVYILYRLRQHLSHAKFRELMVKLADVKKDGDEEKNRSITTSSKLQSKKDSANPRKVDTLANVTENTNLLKNP